MGNPADNGAGDRAKRPSATQLLRAEQKHQTGNSSRLPKQSELRQSPTHSQELINANLCKLSDGISALQGCLSELHRHIDTIRTSIDSSMLLLLPPPRHTTNTTPSVAPASEPEPSEPSEEEKEEEEEEEEVEEVEEEEEEEEEEDEKQQLKSSPRSEPKPHLKEGEELLLKSPPRSEPKSSSLELKSPPCLEPKSSRLEVKSPPRSNRKSPSSEVEILCKTMDSQGLRKYMIRRLSCLKTLQREVPKALKLSPNPARLILEAMNMFYTQGSNAYVEGSPLIMERQAIVLLLECFLKIIGEGGVVEIENAEKEEAGQAALAWYRRLNFEGGIRQAKEIDARGLLLSIGCFGIPQAFRNEDIKGLLHQSYIKMICGSLRRSSVLMAKVPEIIEEMLKQNKVVDAVYFTLCFGLENRFNPKRLLTSFLHETEMSMLNKIQKFEQMKTLPGSVLPEIIGVKKRYLGILKSVIQCLGRNNINHSKFLPEWEIGRKVISLEREIAKLRKELKHDKMLVQKRKIDETECLSNKEVKHSHFSNPCPPQQQRVVNHVDRKDTLLEGGGTAGHVYGHSLYPWVFNGPVACSSQENVVGSLAGPPVGNVAVAGPGAGISAGTDVVLSRVGGSHGDATVYDGLSSHRYAYRPPYYLKGPNTITGDAYMGFSNTIHPPSRLVATGPATELYRGSGSRAVDAAPSGALAYPSSSFNWQR